MMSQSLIGNVILVTLYIDPKWDSRSQSLIGNVIRDPS